MNRTLKAALLGTASFGLTLGTANAQTGFDGPYAGIQFGYHSFGTRESTNAFIVDQPNNNIPTIAFDQSSGSRSLAGVTGGLFGGYGRTVLGRFYVGGEIEGGYSGAANTRSQLVAGCSGAPGTVNHTTSVKAKETYGAAARLGYLIADNVMLYTRFGLQRTRFQVKSSVTSNDDGLTVGGINQSKTLNGFRFGMGAEVLLATLFGPTVNMGNSFLRVDWSHTWYGSKTFSGNNSVNPFGSRQLSVDDNLTLKPTENKFMFGIGLRF